jgi:hypothetical protein
MRKLATLAIALFAIVALAAPVLAQPSNGDLGIYFDSAGTLSTGTAAHFVPFNFYVSGFNLGPISGWESRVSISNPAFLVLSAALNPMNALNVGSQGNFIVGLGQCVDSPGVHTLVTYQLGFFVAPPTPVPTNVLLCTGGATPSSFGGVPGYSSCAGQLNAFGVAQNGGSGYPDGCGVINATQEPPVANENVSFGAVKAGF